MGVAEGRLENKKPHQNGLKYQLSVRPRRLRIQEERQPLCAYQPPRYTKAAATGRSLEPLCARQSVRSINQPSDKVSSDS